MTGANYIRLLGVDRNNECIISGYAPVIGIVGPYLHSTGEWACGAILYGDTEMMEIGEEFLFYLDSGEDWLTVIVTTTFARVSTPDSLIELMSTDR